MSLLLLDKEPRRYERAAARFAALYVERVPMVRLDELAAVVACSAAFAAATPRWPPARWRRCGGSVIWPVGQGRRAVGT